MAAFLFLDGKVPIFGHILERYDAICHRLSSIETANRCGLKSTSRKWCSECGKKHVRSCMNTDITQTTMRRLAGLPISSVVILVECIDVEYAFTRSAHRWCLTHPSWVDNNYMTVGRCICMHLIYSNTSFLRILCGSTVAASAGSAVVIVVVCVHTVFPYLYTLLNHILLFIYFISAQRTSAGWLAG